MCDALVQSYCEGEGLREVEEKDGNGRLAGGVARVQRWKFTGEALRWPVGLLGAAGPSVMRLGGLFSFLY